MTPREDAERWLKEARGNRANAQTLFDTKAYSQCAFHCQQSAEMALKAEFRPDIMDRYSCDEAVETADYY